MKPTTPGPSSSAYERWELPNVGPKLGEGRKIPTRALTAAQIELMQTQAYEEAAGDGRKAGYEAGYQEGTAAARAETETQIQQLNAVLSHLADPIAACDDAVEEALLALVMAVARQLVRRELSIEPREIVAVVREAIAVLPGRDQEARVYLHPEDAELLRVAAAASGGETSWRLVDDPTLTRGGCRVEAGASLVDASVENRLSTVVAHVLGRERCGDALEKGEP